MCTFPSPQIIPAPRVSVAEYPPHLPPPPPPPPICVALATCQSADLTARLCAGRRGWGAERQTVVQFTTSHGLCMHVWFGVVLCVCVCARAFVPACAPLHKQFLLRNRNELVICIAVLPDAPPTSSRLSHKAAHMRVCYINQGWQSKHTHTHTHQLCNEHTHFNWAAAQCQNQGRERERHKVKNGSMKITQYKFSVTLWTNIRL